jgi:hypothetical protein
MNTMPLFNKTTRDIHALASIDDFKNTTFFKSEFDFQSFRCKGMANKPKPCGCNGMIRIYREVLIRLDLARSVAGLPFILTSGCRCGVHNAFIKASKNSDHICDQVSGLVTCGVDIRATNDRERFLIMRGAFAAGFDKIAPDYTRNFVHLGLSYRSDERVSWRYST